MSTFRLNTALSTLALAAAVVVAGCDEASVDQREAKLKLDQAIADMSLANNGALAMADPGLTESADLAVTLDGETFTVARAARLDQAVFHSQSMLGVVPTLEEVKSLGSPAQQATASQLISEIHSGHARVLLTQVVRELGAVQERSMPVVQHGLDAGASLVLAAASRGAFDEAVSSYDQGEGQAKGLVALKRDLATARENVSSLAASLAQAEKTAEDQRAKRNESQGQALAVQTAGRAGTPLQRFDAFNSAAELKRDAVAADAQYERLVQQAELIRQQLEYAKGQQSSLETLIDELTEQRRGLEQESVTAGRAVTGAESSAKRSLDQMADLYRQNAAEFDALVLSPAEQAVEMAKSAHAELAGIAASSLDGSARDKVALEALVRQAKLARAYAVASSALATRADTLKLLQTLGGDSNSIAALLSSRLDALQQRNAEWVAAGQAVATEALEAAQQLAEGEATDSDRGLLAADLQRQIRSHADMLSASTIK